MAGPRPLMVYRDSRKDRIALQEQGHVFATVAAASGYQTLQQPQFSSTQNRYREEDEIGKMAGGGGAVGAWTPAHQQRALAAAAALHRQRLNSGGEDLTLLANSLIRPGQRPLSDWDGGGLSRHMTSFSSGRMERSLLVSDEPMRLRQQQPVVSSILRGGEFPRRVSREVSAGLRLTDAQKEEIRKTELLKTAVRRAHASLLDEGRVDTPRAACQCSSAASTIQQQLESPRRSRGFRFGREESGHAELIARYGDRSSSRNLERAHAAIGPTVQQLGSFSRKRSRDEEADLYRERLIRHRQLSRLDSPPVLPQPPPPPATAASLNLKALLQKDCNLEVQSKAERRLVQVDEDDHEEGQLTPPPPIISHKGQQHRIEYKTQLFKHEEDVKVVTSRTETAPKGVSNAHRYHDGLPFLLFHDSALNARPPSARKNGSVLGGQFHALNSSREHCLPKRERHQSPKCKDKERMLQRLERVGSPFESYSILALDSPDVRRKGANKKSEDHTRPLNSKSVERGHDGLRYKRQHQVEDIPRRHSRSPFNSRNPRFGVTALDSFLMERPSKESYGRIDNDVKRKTPKMGVANDCPLVGEMTISVQKYGQRTVKVEEYKPRDYNMRSASQDTKGHRFSQREGSSRGVLENSLTAGRDRSGITKRKDCEGLPPAASQDKAPRSHSCKNGMTHSQYFQKRTSKDRASPIFQHVKHERDSRTDKYELEPQRQHSIFSRLAGFKPETALTNPRTASETLRQDNSVLPGKMPSSSRTSPTFRAQTSALNVAHGNMLDFQGFPVSTRSTKDTEGSREVAETSLMSINGKNSILEWTSCKQAEQCDRLDKDSLNVRTLDVPKREELTGRQQVEPAEGRLPHPRQSSPVEKKRDSLVKDPRLLECSVYKPDQPKLQPEGVAFPLMESVVPSHLHSADMGVSEVHDLLPGNGFKLHPKVISTGHKKDQFLKKVSHNTDQGIYGTTSSPKNDVVPDENVNQEKSEGRTSSVSAEWMPTVSGCRLESLTLESIGELCGSTPSQSNCKQASPQPNLGDKEPRSIGWAAEAALKPLHSVGTGSIPSSFCLPTTIEPLKSFSKPIELEQLESSKISETPNQTNEVDPLSVVSELHLDREEKRGLLIAPKSSPTLSTPKEVRLFGTNLNAALGEGIESIPKALDIEVEDVVDYPALPATDTSACSEMIMESTVVIQESEKDACLPLEQTGDEQLVHLSKPVKEEETPLIYHDVIKEPTPLVCDLPLVQAQVEEIPLLSQTQFVPLLNLQKPTVAAQGRLLCSSHVTGTHTWRRGTSSTTPANSTSIFKGTSGFGGGSQAARRAQSAQITSYVRKGNTLVRAPGASNLQSANDSKANATVMSGQVRSAARQLPTVKQPMSFKKTFSTNPAALKGFYTAHRKYAAPPTIESDGALPSSLSSINSLGISNGSIELDMSFSPPQEHQSGALSCPEPLVTDVSDDNLGAAGVCRAVNDTSSDTHGTSVTIMPGNPHNTVYQKPVLRNRLYIRRKANQLVVAPVQPVDFVYKESKSSQAVKTGVSRGHYFKRKTNQLVRSSSGKGSSIGNAVEDPLGSDLSHSIPPKQGGGSTLVPKMMRLGRVLRQRKGSPGRSTWVWTLSGAAAGDTSDFSAQSLRTGSLLFPWKRQNSLRTAVPSQRLRALPEGSRGSLLFLMSKRLRKVPPVQPVYTRSADGFSLHRSGVMSLGGGNLKWTKSLEKRAKQASEQLRCGDRQATYGEKEATKAVAEAERRKRENKEAVIEATAKMKDGRRATRKPARGEGERIVWVGLVRYKMDAASKTLQRIPDSEGEAGDPKTISPTGLAKSSPLLTPKRSIIGGTVYLRVGNGNQLVRDPKTASRALASEKVRWSLHNARSRGAKKQQYCLFFTKFGKCNKESGKCSYIHDPDKVAVCTKFLNGNCNDGQCLLTHKVIPERMPDCSFFLEGICTNESCPYRHVSVNPKAPYCQGFLLGYCKDGDKCNRKHTYVCSVYAETGECLERSTCKFHHPKKKDKLCRPVGGRKIGTKGKRRYFYTVEPHPIRQKIDAADPREDSVENGEGHDAGSMEFISLSNIESDEDQQVSVQSQPWQRPGVTFTAKEAGFAEEMEKWIKPTFLLQAAAH